MVSVMVVVSVPTQPVVAGTPSIGVSASSSSDCGRSSRSTSSCPRERRSHRLDTDAPHLETQQIEPDALQRGDDLRQSLGGELSRVLQLGLDGGIAPSAPLERREMLVVRFDARPQRRRVALEAAHGVGKRRELLAHGLRERVVQVIGRAPERRLGEHSGHERGANGRRHTDAGQRREPGAPLALPESDLELGQWAGHALKGELAGEPHRRDHGEPRRQHERDVQESR
jgi:hypothetical protein